MANKDIIDTALADNIDKMRSNFAEEMAARLADRMNERKQEIAKSYFGQKAE